MSAVNTATNAVHVGQRAPALPGVGGASAGSIGASGSSGSSGAWPNGSVWGPGTVASA